MDSDHMLIYMVISIPPQQNKSTLLAYLMKNTDTFDSELFHPVFFISEDTNDNQISQYDKFNSIKYWNHLPDESMIYGI